MKKLQYFIAYISNDFSVDLWADLEVFHGIKMADEMPPSDWKILCGSWMNYEPMVQERIAEIAGAITNFNSDTFQMLIAMLSSEIVDVVERSIDSLNSIAQLTPEYLDMKKIERALEGIEPNDHVIGGILNCLKRIIKQNS